MAITWDPKLSVGVTSVDLQHQELFRRVGALLEAMQKGTGKDSIANLLTFLEQYVIQHFAAEQKLMATYGYPARADHEREHDDFVHRFLGFCKDFETRGCSSTLAISLGRFLCPWLYRHIGSSDKALGQFLISKRVADAGPAME